CQPPNHLPVHYPKLAPLVSNQAAAADAGAKGDLKPNETMEQPCAHELSSGAGSPVRGMAPYPRRSGRAHCGCLYAELSPCRSEHLPEGTESGAFGTILPQ